MVINSNPAPDATSLQKETSPAKNNSRATAGANTSSPSVATTTASIFAAENPPGMSEIIDNTAADKSLAFLHDNILANPSLALTAQANQIPASVLQLLQP